MFSVALFSSNLRELFRGLEEILLFNLSHIPVFVSRTSNVAVVTRHINSTHLHKDALALVFGMEATGEVIHKSLERRENGK